MICQGFGEKKHCNNKKKTLDILQQCKVNSKGFILWNNLSYLHGILCITQPTWRFCRRLRLNTKPSLGGSPTRRPQGSGTTSLPKPRTTSASLRTTSAFPVGLTGYKGHGELMPRVVLLLQQEQKVTRFNLLYMHNK